MLPIARSGLMVVFVISLQALTTASVNSPSREYFDSSDDMSLDSPPVREFLQYMFFSLGFCLDLTSWFDLERRDYLHHLNAFICCGSLRSISRQSMKLSRAINSFSTNTQ